MSRQGSAIRPADRRASTITEVLMALMIMGIGLVSLASLFPIAVLRAVKATQLTRATNLRYNAAATVDLYPHLVHNPDRDINPTTGWQYAFPPGTTRHNVDEDINLDGVLQTNNPNEDTNGTGFLERPNYMVDPLGWNSDQIEPLLKNYFGNDGAGNPIAWLRRYNGGFGKELDYDSDGVLDANEDLNGNGFFDPGIAPYLFTYADDWVVQYEVIPIAVQSNPNGQNNAPSVEMPPEANLGQFFVNEDLNGNGIRDTVELNWNDDPTTNPPYDSSNIFETQGSRITFFGGPTGRESLTRTITGKVIQSSNFKNTIAWSVDQKFDPTVFPVERVRVESQQRRFTWMLTVRQAPNAVPPEASVDLVVFANRSFSPLDERVYPPLGIATTLPAATPQLSQRTSAFEVGRPDSNLVYVAYDTSFSGSRPPIKKGGFVLDVMNAIWYRIQDFREPNQGTVVVQIDRPAIANSALPLNPGAPIPPSAIFMQNIVDVYPLGSR